MMDAAINPSSNMLARESLAETVLETTRAPCRVAETELWIRFEISPLTPAPNGGVPMGSSSGHHCHRLNQPGHQPGPGSGPPLDLGPL